MIDASFRKRFKDEVEPMEHRFADGTSHLVPHWRHAHPAVHNVNDRMEASFTTLERLAMIVTVRVGSPGFFLIILTWTLLWLGWNLLAPLAYRFDPAPAFVLWLFMSNMIQLFLMPLIMVGQNLLSRHTELRAEEDFAINQKAEQEVEAVLLHLEHQTASLEHQSTLILEILHRLDAPSRPGA
jgi:uncharacterized membrane protein